MKKYLLPSLKLTLVLLVICSALYPLFIAAVAKLAPGGGKGETLSVNGKVVGYKNIGQNFTDDKYSGAVLLQLPTMQLVPQVLIKGLPTQLI